MIFRLLGEVLECQKSYNSLLKKTLEDQRDQAALLKLTAEQNIAIRVDRCSGCRDYSDFDYVNGAENSDCSKDLIEWLRSVGIDENSIKKVRQSKICMRIFCRTVSPSVYVFSGVTNQLDGKITTIETTFFQLFILVKI